MVGFIRSLLSHWVFAEERATWDAQLKSLEKKRKELDARDVVRDRMKSYNPRRFKGSDLIDSVELNPEMDTNAFLSRVHELSKNKEFRYITDYLVHTISEHIIRHAGTQEEINFNRYSINGIELIEEEIQELEDEYQKRKSSGEDFDKYQVT